MRHFVIVCAGLVWSGIAVLLHVFFGVAWSDVPEMFPKFAIAGVVTSYVITALFRRHLVIPSSQKKGFLPLATISCGVSIWSVTLFTLAAVQSLIEGRNDLFDGFGYFIIMAVAVSLTVALPITYPVAYLTQSLISRYAKEKRG